MFENRSGKPMDIAPWCYIWKRGSSPEKPEAQFIPRRLKRVDEVYRTAKSELGEKVKSICYIQNDLLEDYLPAPKNPLLSGAMWVGGLADYEITLEWDSAPETDDIEVRTYPSAWGWFGLTVDRLLILEKVSRDKRVRSYRPDPNLTMDFAYNKRVKAATRMIAVFAPAGCSVPKIHITGKDLGEWKAAKLKVEWGFGDGEDCLDFKGEFESHNAVIGEPKIDRQNKCAVFECLYSDKSRFGNDSRLTVITDKERCIGATVLIRDAVTEPICVPEVGLYFCNADYPETAEEFIAKCGNKKSVREMVKTHPEAKTFEEIFNKTRLFRCPEGTSFNEFPKGPEPNTIFNVPDKHLQRMYEYATEQLRGHNMWGFLAAEVARPTLAMELIGLYDEADKIYDYYLPSPGIKADGDFSNAEGSLEWAKTMRHDMGYAHEGTHYSTGRLLFSMMYRYLLTEDIAWLNERLPRLKKAADFIIRESENYVSDFENREKLHCYGLIPPGMLGDYALPACDWQWYYSDNAYNQMGLDYFARVLDVIGDGDAAFYKKHAEIYKGNLTRAFEREALYAPVRRDRSGFSKSYVPRMAYAGGLLHFGDETDIPQFALGICDLFQGALPLGEIGGIADADDRRMVGTINTMEEVGMNVSLTELEKIDHPVADPSTKQNEAELVHGNGEAKAEGEDAWFWNTFSNLPKCSHNANIYLRQDDIENFLHFFLNHAAVMVGTNGKMWEHAHPDVFVECNDPDNGTAGWFAECFRKMLLCEDGDVLWLAKGTPRSWLAQGQKIEIAKAMSFFGQVEYCITSDADNGRICTSVKVPTRNIVPILKLRLRHPEGKKIVSVTLNGKNYENIAPDRETILLEYPRENAEIVAYYR